jgi:hypothetical protein
MSSLSYVNGISLFTFYKAANVDLNSPAEKQTCRQVSLPQSASSTAPPSFSSGPESSILTDGLAEDSLTATHYASHETGKEIITRGQYMLFSFVHHLTLRQLLTSGTRM